MLLGNGKPDLVPGELNIWKCGCNPTHQQKAICIFSSTCTGFFYLRILPTSVNQTVWNPAVIFAVISHLGSQSRSPTTTSARSLSAATKVPPTPSVIYKTSVMWTLKRFLLEQNLYRKRCCENLLLQLHWDSEADKWPSHALSHLDKASTGAPPSSFDWAAITHSLIDACVCLLRVFTWTTRTRLINHRENRRKQHIPLLSSMHGYDLHWKGGE